MVKKDNSEKKTIRVYKEDWKDIKALTTEEEESAAEVMHRAIEGYKRSKTLNNS